MRRFKLMGYVIVYADPGDDTSAESRYTKVAEGCEFSDGACAVHWMNIPEATSIVAYENGAQLTGMEKALRIHTGVGHWIVEWIDG